MRRTPPVLFAVLVARLADASPPKLTPDLRIEAVVDSRRLGARLTNAGLRPVHLVVGHSCSGPSDFLAQIDEHEVSFSTDATLQRCTVNRPIRKMLRPGESLLAWSRTITLDGKAHRVVVHYVQRFVDRDTWVGEVTSPPHELAPL